MPTRVVTLSHETGAGGETIGRTVANGLGFRYIDEEIITLVRLWSACTNLVTPRASAADGMVGNVRTGAGVRLSVRGIHRRPPVNDS
jgi:cytidylate kinase-like protein